MKVRSSFFALVLMVSAAAAHADYLDVITNEMTGDCTMEKYLGVVEEFRGVMSSQGYSYTVEIVVPITGDNLSNVFWVGRTPDFATFGAEYTKWLTALGSSSSAESKVNTKLTKCATNLSRTGSLTQ